MSDSLPFANGEHVVPKGILGRLSKTDDLNSSVVSRMASLALVSPKPSVDISVPTPTGRKEGSFAPELH